MTERGDLLELLHGAGGSFQTLASRWRCWRDDQRAHAAFTAANAGSGSVVVASATGPPQPPGSGHEEVVRLWVAKPDRIREEHVGGDADGALAVQLGSTWWSYSPHLGAMTNHGDERQQHGIGQMFQPLLEPAGVMGLFDMELTGRAERAGHSVICAAWRRRALTDHDRFALHQLGTGAQEHAVEVDAERGVVLRLEARFEGEPMAICEVLDVTYDVELDDELFRFVAPDGEEPRTPASLHRFQHGVALHEAAAMMPFAVYTLSDAPAGWNLPFRSSRLHSGHRFRPLCTFTTAIRTLRPP